MLEEVVDEPADVLALLRELLDERERTGRVVVDDEIAELEQRLLVDGAEQLQHGLHGQLAARRSRELVEQRHGVAETALRRAGDLRQRRLRRLEAFALGRRGRSTLTRSSKRGRANENVWQRERTVGITFCSAVVQNTNSR